MAKVLLLFTLSMGLLFSSMCFAVPNYDMVKTIARIARNEGWVAINNGASSVSVAVMVNNQIIYSEGFGAANRSLSTPVDAHTQYGIGSVSKAFASVAILQMCEQGKVGLDVPVTKYLPEFKMADARYKQITVRMLLNHSSGLPGSNIYLASTTNAVPDYIRQTLEYCQVSTLKSNPGAISVYCNDGFTLLQAIVERVSGMSYSDYLKKNIYTLAGMKNSGGYFSSDNNIARAYDNKNGYIQPIEYDNSLGSGGLTSTPEDLCAFTAALCSGKLIGAKMLAEMERNQTAPNTNPLGKDYSNYGLGLDSVSVRDFEAQGVQVLAKNGGIQEYHSQLYFAPQSKIALAVIIAGPGNPTAMSNKIMQKVLEAVGAVKHLDTVVELTKPDEQLSLPPDIDKYAGCYGSAKDVCKISFDKQKHTMDVMKLVNGGFVTGGSYPYMGDGLFRIATSLGYRLVEKAGTKYIMLENIDNHLSIVQYECLVGQMADTSLYNDCKWLPYNCKADDVIVPETVFTTGAIGDVPGLIYAAFSDTTLAYGLNDARTSKMILMHARDQMDMRIINKNGKKLLCAGNAIYIEAKDIVPWKKGEKIVIDAAGMDVVRCIKQDTLLSSDFPVNGRLIVYGANGEVQFDSLYSSDKTIVINAGSYVIFIGRPGAEFNTR